MKRALLVGRFQPFHLGHLHAVKHAMKNSDELIIAVGSSQYSHTLENPFTAGERISMIRLALQEAGLDLSKVLIIPVPDTHVHSLWVPQLVSYTPSFTEVYTNEPLTAQLFLEAGFKVRPIPFLMRELYSATEIRRRILEGDEWEALVPASVVGYIKEVKGVERIKGIAKVNKVR